MAEAQPFLCFGKLNRPKGLSNQNLIWSIVVPFNLTGEISNDFIDVLCIKLTNIWHIFDGINWTQVEPSPPKHSSPWFILIPKCDNLILAISERLNLEKAGVNVKDVSVPIVWFKNKLLPKSVLEILDSIE